MIEIFFILLYSVLCIACVMGEVYKTKDYITDVASERHD
jgi:hypothetical protein